VPTPSGDVVFGENCPLVLVAGPCAVENEQMIIETALRVKAAGAKFWVIALNFSIFVSRSWRERFGTLVAAQKASGLGLVTEVVTLLMLRK